MSWAIIFDLDGVIADTEVLNARASVMAFKDLYNMDVNPEDFKPFIGTGDESYVEGVAKKYSIEIDVDAVVERRRLNFVKLLNGKPLPAMPGVLELIKATRKDSEVLLAIATSGNKDKQFPIIEGAGLMLEWFTIIITGDDITRKKPNPEIYMMVAKHLDVEPSRCVVFEDSPAGVKAAKSANMKCVAVTSSTERENLRDADVIVRSLSEVSFDRVKMLVLKK